MSIRGCLEVCCSPNTVSKFIRLFPKLAILFLILHIGAMMLTAFGYWNHDKVQTTPKDKLPVAPNNDLGFIPVRKPDNWDIPSRRMAHKNNTDVEKKRRKKRRPLKDPSEKLRHH